MLSQFPLQHWLSFQKVAPIARLLESLDPLKYLEAWPVTSDWQGFAHDRGVWDDIGLTLIFTHDEKLGQRAKRKRAPGAGRSYEAAIMEKSEIPTRAADLHDFFNAIIWLNFPRAKFALHGRALVVQKEWAKTHDLQKRCPLADRLTCFDEGGIIFELPEELGRNEVEALIQSRDDRRKKELVDRYRANFRIFGHGMMEVMMKGNTEIYASCIILDYAPDTLDRKLARYLAAFDTDTPDHGAINVSWLISPHEKTPG